MSLSRRTSLSRGLVLALTVLLTCGTARAQSNGDGSIYSRYGLGILTDYSSPQSEALGEGAYALRSLNYNPTANPALWSDQVFTRLSAGGRYKRVVAQSGEGQTSRLTSGSIEALQFSFPIYERTLGVGLSFQPYSQHNYRLRTQGTVPLNDTTSVPYTRNFRGKGGLHVFRGGLGYRVTDWLSVGANVNVLFGILAKKRSTKFEARSFRDLTVSDDTRLAGVSGTLGAHFAFANVFLEEDAFSLGTSVALPTTLSGTRVFTRGEGRNLPPDTIASVEGTLSLPWQGRFGAAYQPNARWTFTADALYEPWSNFKTTFSSPPPFETKFPVRGENLTDRWRVSLGTAFLPAGENLTSGYFANVAYRLGFYVERSYVRPNGQDLQTYALTGGLSFPTSLPGTRIDLTVNAGQRGTTANALVQDTFYGVSLHVNFGERWFQERKLR